jgi:PadR family transcriptional regulator PadR
MEAVENFKTKIEKEMRSGFIAVLLLHIIDKCDEPTYGYKIIKEINVATKGKLNFQEGTVYPILRFLQSKEFITPFLGESPTGAPRKYYRITRSGKKALEEGMQSWTDFRDALDNVFRSTEALS